ASPGPSAHDPLARPKAHGSTGLWTGRPVLRASCCTTTWDHLNASRPMPLFRGSKASPVAPRSATARFLKVYRCDIFARLIGCPLVSDPRSSLRRFRTIQVFFDDRLRIPCDHRSRPHLRVLCCQSKRPRFGPTPCIAGRTAMTFNRAWLLLAAFFVNPLGPASADVITDWDERAVAFIQPRMVPPAAYRAMAIVHIAMFDAVNLIEPRYRAYSAQLPATRQTSKEAAAAAAAGAVLTNLVPEAASDIQAALQNYLSGLPENEA